MRMLSLRRCHAALSHLLVDRRAQVLRLRSGPVHVETFERLREEVGDALDRRAVRADDPVSGLVAQHVSFGSALAKSLDALRSDPLQDPETRAAAEVVYESVVEGRIGPAHSVVARLDYTDAVRRLVPSLAQPLGRLPASIGALLDGWLAVGDTLRDALANRADEAPGDDGAVALVRSVTAALNRLRRAVRHEVEVWDDLPPDLERRLFGFVEILQVRRRRVDVSPFSPPAEPELEPAPPPERPIAPGVGPVEALESA